MKERGRENIMANIDLSRILSAEQVNGTQGNQQGVSQTSESSCLYWVSVLIVCFLNFYVFVFHSF